MPLEAYNAFRNKLRVAQPSQKAAPPAECRDRKIDIQSQTIQQKGRISKIYDFAYHYDENWPNEQHYHDWQYIGEEKQHNCLQERF